ncbi:hypothetical protein SESBI_00321 [Sesbania bispinosa]|nr:hypothetical protein SESBI_00321 [Sesbania bispinosa]
MKERLKHRPNTISEAHFKQLMTYWRNSNVQRAKKENRGEITQAEMFIETRKSRKGKDLDEGNTKPNLKIQFKTPLKLRHFNHCLATKSLVEFVAMEELSHLQFLKNEEIAAIKKQHSNEVTSMKREMEGLKSLVKTMLKQQNPNLNEEEVDNMMATALGYENSAGPRLSASSHVPYQEEVSSYIRRKRHLSFLLFRIDVFGKVVA